MRGCEWFGQRRRPNKHRGDNAPSLKRQNERGARALKLRQIERDNEKIERKHHEPES